MKKTPPDTRWLLKWVGFFMPEDEIFKKSYKFVRPKRAIEVEEEYFSNDDGLYDDLPPLEDKIIKKTNRLRGTKATQLKRKIAACKLR